MKDMELTSWKQRKEMFAIMFHYCCALGSEEETQWILYTAFLFVEFFFFTCLVFSCRGFKAMFM